MKTPTQRVQAFLQAHRSAISDQSAVLATVKTGLHGNQVLLRKDLEIILAVLPEDRRKVAEAVSDMSDAWAARGKNQVVSINRLMHMREMAIAALESGNPSEALRVLTTPTNGNHPQGTQKEQAK